MADTTRIPIDFRSPAVSHDTGAYYSVESLTTATPDFDLGVWVFPHTSDPDTYIYGVVTVPNTIGVTPAAKVILRVAANATTGNIRTRIASLAVADAESFNQALTAETEQTTSMPATAYETEEISYTLTNAPSAKDVILVEFRREASDTVNDTLAADLLLVEAYLEIDLS